MLAQALRFPDDARLVTGPGWRFERKLDGLRCIAVREPGRVRLWSRNHLPFNDRFPGVARDVAALPAPSLVLDGEIVRFEEGRTRFQHLQESGSGAVLVAFDLLFLLGRDIRELPLSERVGLLAQVVGGEGPVLQAEALDGDPVALFSQACARGWEGLVAKRAGSPYRSGRSPDWRKLKCVNRQELVVVGWKEPAGTRTGFGSLLLAYHDSDGRLVPAGRVGTGFDQATLRRLGRRLADLEVPDSPLPGAGRQPGVHWVRPELVAEVAFREWTRDGRLRHPSFIGLRDDKPAGSVVRELPTP
jgi:bifunctional non-homologous end joining protein LigD